MFISKKWKWFWVMICLMLAELAGTVATLALFGVASPNAYRTQMWKIGGEYGFNSRPSIILYAHANYRPIPQTPMVWSQFITDFNIIVSVLSMFILLIKVVLFIMHFWIPIVSLFVNIVVLALWCVSVYGQAGPDNMDPEHPSSVAWYITKSCSLAEKYNQKHNCVMAKGCFAASVLMVAIFLFNIILAIWSMFPTKEQKAKRAAKLARRAEEEEEEKEMEKEWELRNMSQIKTPTFAPYTPRTMAFKSLDRQLPLRTDRSAYYR